MFSLLLNELLFKDLDNKRARRNGLRQLYPTLIAKNGEVCMKVNINLKTTP